MKKLVTTFLGAFCMYMAGRKEGEASATEDVARRKADDLRAASRVWLVAASAVSKISEKDLEEAIGADKQ